MGSAHVHVDLLSFRCLGANFKVFVANVFGAKARLSLTPVHRRECQSRALGKLPRTLIRAGLVPQTRLRPGDGLPASRDSGERIIVFDNLRRPPPPPGSENVRRPDTANRES